MDGVTETEGTFDVEGISLYTKTWTPSGPIKAKLVFVHGFSDHVGRYYSFFPTLASRGVVVYGFDQRGWGRSVRRPSDRGLTGATPLVLADIASFLRSKLECEPRAAPTFVMGHSMGGAEVLTLASEKKYADLIGQVRGWLLESPFIDFHPDESPNWATVMMGKVAAKVMPHWQMRNPVPPEAFSRDPEVVQSIKDDELCHATGTLEGLAGLLERGARLRSGRTKLLLPVAESSGDSGGDSSNGVRSLILIHGTDDRTAWYDASKAWWDAHAGGVPDGEFHDIVDGYHQLHADLCRDEFYQVVGDWILARVEGGAKTTAKL